MKKLTILLSFYLMCVSAINAQTYSGGSGTQASPYLISTKADMAALANAVNDGNIYSGKYFLLINDIVGSNNVITTSIGSHNGMTDNTGIPFSGIFDGGGHEIEINNTVGVFGYLDNATVENLGVK